MQLLNHKHNDVDITVGEVDETSENGQILPGLSDISVRLYGCSISIVKDVLINDSFKRKRV